MSKESFFKPVNKGLIDIPPSSHDKLFVKRADQSDDDSKENYKRPLSEVVSDTIYIERNQKFSYRSVVPQLSGPPITMDRSYLRPIYDIDEDNPVGSRDMVLQWARQTEKSTTAACKLLVLGSAIPGLKGLCVQPRFSQVTVFSQQRFKKIAEDTPTIKAERLSTRNIWQVSMKGLTNGSIVNFRSCYLSADSVRGISADFLNIDEMQDILSDNIPIVEECLSHALPDRKFKFYTGTPKTKMNPLCRRYEHSSQFEWMVVCGHCGFSNYVDENIIGDKFYVCGRCGKEVYPNVQRRDEVGHIISDHGGEWQAMKPSYMNERMGFRISQIMVPFKTFSEIKAKQNDPAISHAVFLNEVLGLPSEEGELVLTEPDMIRACENRPMATPQTAKMIVGDSPVFMGIDHGTGLRSMEVGGKMHTVSYTVVVIGAWGRDEKFHILYMEKFLGDDASLSKQPEKFDRLARTWNAVYVGSDWGFGAINNERLVDSYRWFRRPVQSRDPILLEYQSVRQKPLVAWSDKAGTFGRYMLDRNQGMTTIVDAIKRGIIRFPEITVLQRQPNKNIPFIDDFLAIYIEYDDRHQIMNYDHTLPDDTFQALMLCYFAGQQYYGRLIPSMMPAIPIE